MVTNQGARASSRIRSANRVAATSTMQATVDGVVTPFTVDPHIDGFGRAPTIVGDGELNDDDSTTVYRITDGTFDILGDR